MWTTPGIPKGRHAASVPRPSAAPVALLAIGLALVTGGAAPSAGSDSFEFPKGTRWIYEGNYEGTKKTLSQEVVRVSTKDLVWKDEPATVFHLAIKTLNTSTGGFELEATTGYLGLEGGYLLTGSPEGPPVRIFKLNSREGDSWPCIDPRITGPSDLVFTHLGEEEITVPAGSFKDARHIQVVIQSDGARHVGDMYIVPRIGIVKTRTLSEGYGQRKELVLELRKFSIPREY